MLLLVLVDGKNTMSGVFGAWLAFIRSAIRVCFSFAVSVLSAERPAKITTYSSVNSLSIAESNKDFGMMGEVGSLEVKAQNSKACSRTARVEAEIKRKDGTCAARISKALRVPPESAFHWPAEWWETFSVFTLAGTSRERFTLTTFTFRLFFTPV